MVHKNIFRQIILPIIISIILSAIIMRTWPSNGTLGYVTTNYFGHLLKLDGEDVYDAAWLEAWFEISLFLLAVYYGFRKFAAIWQAEKN
jgi:hypothetical protein